MNQFNALHGDEPDEPPRECNRQPPAAHFKYSTFTSKTNPVVSDIMGRLNYNTIDNGGVKVTTSQFTVQFNSESVPDPDTTPIKSIYGDEMDRLLAFLHSEHDDDILDVDLQMLQTSLVVAPTSNFYTLSTVLFHKDVGANVAVTNCMSQFSMFVPTKVTIKLAY